MNPKILHVLETCVYCDDLAAARRFYVDILRLSVHSQQEDRHIFLRCGTGMVLVFRSEHTRTIVGHVNGALVPPHGANGPGHVAFAVTESDLPGWRARFAAHKIEIESEINWPTGGRSIYVRDPAGNSVELATPNLWNG